MCSDCGKEKTRYEVKIGTKTKTYDQCWPCYDKMMKIDNQAKYTRRANYRAL